MPPNAGLRGCQNRQNRPRDIIIALTQRGDFKNSTHIVSNHRHTVSNIPLYYKKPKAVSRIAVWIAWVRLPGE